MSETKVWTDEHTLQMEKLHADNKSFGEAVRVLGFSRKMVSDKSYHLGPWAAHVPDTTKAAEARREIGRKSLKKATLTGRPRTDLTHIRNPRVTVLKDKVRYSDMVLKVTRAYEGISLSAGLMSPSEYETSPSAGV